MKKYHFFLFERFQFLEVNFSIYFNMLVFVMPSGSSVAVCLCLYVGFSSYCNVSGLISSSFPCVWKAVLRDCGYLG